jgi:UDP-glucuronate decarboxylase
MALNDGRVVSNFIVQALRGQPITLYGDGTQTRAFCYIDDLVEGLVRIMATDDDVTGPVNLGNPAEMPIRELAELIVDLTGARSRLEFRPLPQDDPKQRCPDIALAKEKLGWQPRVSLKEGLAKTIPYFEELLRSGEGI